MVDYLQDYPSSQLSLQTFSSTKIRDWVAEGQFDLGVIETQDDLSDLDIVPYRLRMHLAVPPESPLVNRSLITPKDLDELPLVTLYEHHQSIIKLKQAFRSGGSRFRVSIETHLFTAAISLVNAGLGYALVDPVSADSFLRHHDCRLPIVPFEPAIDLEIALVTSRFHPPSRLCQSFMTYLKVGLEDWQRRSLGRMDVTGSHPEDPS